MRLFNDRRRRYVKEVFRYSFFGNVQNIACVEESKFNMMSLSERSDVVWQQGQFVDSVICSDYCLMLYSVKRQFIELCLDLRTQSIVWISLANDLDISKYIDHIRIEV